MGQGHQGRRYPVGMSCSSNLTLAAALVAALSAATAQAQIYECTDARGARQFAQFCPAGTVRQREVVRGDEVPVAAPDVKSSAQQEVDFKKRMQQRQEADAKAAEMRGKTDEAERNCGMARMQLKGLLEGQRMQRLDPDTGERINLGDAERAADAERQQALIEQWCK